MKNEKCKRRGVRERPILFSGPMVRAILDGRKTQTRHVVTPQPLTAQMISSGMASLCYPAMLHRPCPYGRPGERLWVRETWQMHKGDEGTQCVLYRADNVQWTEGRPWKPGSYMPRWASRLTLEITAVRVERVQEISEEDAKAEGVAPVHHFGNGPPIRTYRGAYPVDWTALNAKRGFGWEKNPWVWVIEFNIFSSRRSQSLTSAPTNRKS